VAGSATFLAQVESAGLMTLLTADILDRSLAWIAGWRASGQVQKVAVNISVTTLLDPEFPTQVAELLRRHQLPGAALDLELTEDLLMADPSRARNVIDALVSLGVGIIIDDYGTGYSNLGYLRDPIGIRGLKLDRSFITGLDNNHRARAIVASTLALARALDLTMVAEGVETAAERNVLVDLGCRLAQGYHFARPMSAADFESAQLETPSTPLTLRSDTPTR
jgi:EAL domain-containing protein (putative c-di-GMP-specific phosphodiesterase class I)